MDGHRARLGQALAGRVVVVAAHGRVHDLGPALARRGATVRHVPLHSLVRADESALLVTTKDLLARPPDVAIVLSGAGLRAWVDVARAAGLAEDLLDVLATCRVVAQGPSARGASRAAGLTPDWVADAETSEEVLEVLLSEGVAGRRVALVHHGGGTSGLDTELAAAGADVVGVVVHRWGPAPAPAVVEAGVRAAADGDVDAVVLTTRRATLAWLDAAEGAHVLGAVLGRMRSGALVAATLGGVPAEPLLALGVTPVVPERARMGRLLQAVVAHFEQDTTVAADTVCGHLEVRPKVALLDGHVLPLHPGGHELLRLLVGARGQVVTREEVLETLPGFASDSRAAEVAVARLREDSHCPDLVTTVVRQGYRLALEERGAGGGSARRSRGDLR